jgi:hypothetical protein
VVHPRNTAVPIAKTPITIPTMRLPTTSPASVG